MIALTDVSQTFLGRSGAVEALRGMDLHVDDGEFVAVVGRAGCGKSTLLRILARLLAPTPGRGLVGNPPGPPPPAGDALLFHAPPPPARARGLAHSMLPPE